MRIQTIERHWDVHRGHNQRQEIALRSGLVARETNRYPDTARRALAQFQAASMQLNEVMHNGQAYAGPGHGPV